MPEPFAVGVLLQGAERFCGDLRKRFIGAMDLIQRLAEGFADVAGEHIQRFEYVIFAVGAFGISANGVSRFRIDELRGEGVFLAGAGDAARNQRADIFTLANFATYCRSDTLVLRSAHALQHGIHFHAREYVGVARLFDADGEGGGQGTVEARIAGLILKISKEHGIAGVERKRRTSVCVSQYKPPAMMATATASEIQIVVRAGAVAAVAGGSGAAFCVSLAPEGGAGCLDC